MNLIAEPFSRISMKISDENGARYKLKVKVNTKEKELSTAKLTDAEKNTYRIAKELISWKGCEEISSSRIVELIYRGDLIIRTQLTKEAGLFNVNICVDCTKPPLGEDEIGILSVKTVEDYVEYYSQNGRPAHLALNCNRLANTFTDIRHLSDLYRHEMVYLCEFLTSQGDCKRVISKLLDSSSTEQIQSMIEQLHVKGNKAQDNFRTSLEYEFSKEKLRNGTKVKNLTSDVSSEVKEGLFSSVFASKFPWVEGLKTQQGQLNSDKELSDYELYMPPLKGVNAKNVTKPMKELLDAALFSGERRTTLIIGKPASEISLFLQSYVKELLNNYRVKNSLPFFVKLRNIDLGSQFIPQILKLYGLEKYQECLKQLPIVWFLDGYRELFLNKERRLNIHILDDVDRWPNSRFVFTSLQGFEYRYFAPLREEVTLLGAAPFNSSDIEEFLNKYIKKPGLSPHWTKEKYLQCIGMLQEVIDNPFYLKQIVDYLSDSNPLTLPLEKNSDKQFLLDLIVSSSIMREVEKLNGKITAEGYCEVIMNIARLMCILSKHTVSAIGRDSNYTKEERQKNGEKKELLFRIELEIEEKNRYEIELQTAEDEAVKNRLIQAIELNNSEVLKVRKRLDTINLLQKCEQELDNYLFGEEYLYIHTGPMIAQTITGDKKFAYDILEQYFSQLTNDPEAKMRLIALLK